ncbi:unnamed protein product, partial [Prorocentrum cordatum]
GGLEGRVDIPTPPSFLQDGRASSILEGVERASGPFDLAGLQYLATKVGCIFVSQVPDAAPSNGRALGFIHRELAGLRNVFENPIDMGRVIGDVHANAAVHRSTLHHNAVATALGKLLLDERAFEFNALELPPRGARGRAEAVLWFSLGKGARGALDNEGAAANEQQGHAVVKRKIDGIPQYVNGDIRDERIVHYERCCGMCANRLAA